MIKNALIFLVMIFFSLTCYVQGYAKGNFKVTNEMIYQKLLEIEKRQAILEAQFKEFKEATNKRFENMNKRFEQVNERFNDLIKFLWIIASVFGSLVAILIGLIIWDRRTAIEKTEAKMREKYKLELLLKLLDALRELAKEDEKVARILRSFGLL